jgi:hypothetical protein
MTTEVEAWSTSSVYFGMFVKNECDVSTYCPCTPAGTAKKHHYFCFEQGFTFKNLIDLLRLAIECLKKVVTRLSYVFIRTHSFSVVIIDVGKV